MVILNERFLKGQKFLAIFFVLCAGAVFSPHAQTGPEEDWVTPGRAAVQRELGYARALAPDIQTKLAVISEIREKARSGGVPADDQNTLRLLRYLAEEGTRNLAQNQRFAAKSFPEARRASCEVLGFVGGQTSREILLDVLKADPEPMVLSEAVFALGKITAEPDEEIILALRVLLKTKILVPGGDNNLAMALLGTIEKLVDSKTGLRDERLFGGLLLMLEAPLSQSVRQKTRRLIGKMTGF
jgi:hypothetical protein